MVFGWLKAGLRRADAESRGANAGLGTGGGLEYATSGKNSIRKQKTHIPCHSSEIYENTLHQFMEQPSK